MYTHPFSGSQLERERHRQMRAQVGGLRLARQLRSRAPAARLSRECPYRGLLPFRESDAGVFYRAGAAGR